MNNRFKELAVQVDLWATPGKIVDSSADHNDKVIEFAELVVLECSQFLKDTLDDHFAAEQIEEHFGVHE